MNKDNIFVRLYRNTHLWIVLTCIGVWVLVFLHFSEEETKRVYVVGGEVDAEVRGNVSVDNTVDVNLYKINNHRDCFYGYGNNDYYSIPVSVR